MRLVIGSGNEAWRDWTKHIPGAIFTEGRTARGNKIIVPLGRWQVSVDLYLYNARRGAYITRVHTPYAPLNKFKFKLIRKSSHNALDDFTRATGVSLLKNIETRNPAFNDRYRLKSNDETRARSLFENPRVLKHIPNRHDFIFCTGRRNALERHMPAGAGSMTLWIAGQVNDPRFAYSLCLLVGETMRALDG